MRWRASVWIAMMLAVILVTVVLFLPAGLPGRIRLAKAGRAGGRRMRG